MSCKSLLFATNSTDGTAIAAGGSYPITTITRRFGCAANLVNDAIVLSAPGYYYISGAVSATATAAGTITVALYQDGNLIPGTDVTAQAVVVGSIITLPINGVARIYPTQSSSVITVVVTGQAVTTNTANITVEKV